MDMNTWEPNYYKDYTGELKIYQLDRDNAATYVVELFEVYPKTITAQAIIQIQLMILIILYQWSLCIIIGNMLQKKQYQKDIHQ